MMVKVLGRVAQRGTLSCFIAAAALLAACSDEPTGPSSRSLGKVVSAAVIDTAGSIFRSLNVQLDKPARLEVYYAAAGSGPVLRMRADSQSLLHSILLPRLFASKEYLFAVRSYADTLTSDSIWRGTFHTGALPADLQNFNYTMEGEPGFPMIMAPFRTTPGGFAGQVAFDTRGRGIVWFMRSAGGGTLVATPIPDSHDLLFIEGGFPGDPRNGLVRATPSAQVAALLQRGSGEFGQIHHDIVAVAENRVLFLAFDPRTIRDTLVNGEAIWEWNTTTGAVTKKWSAWDFLDWDTDRTANTAPGSWLHANSITIGPRGNYIVSFRTLSQVISIAPDFKSLEWRMGGPHATIKVAPADAFRGQHSVREVAPNRVLVFDNQGGGAADDHSRIMEYQIVGDTARVAFTYEPNPPLSALLRGGTYRLPNGNTLAIFTSLPFEVHEVTADGARHWRMTGDLTFANMFRAAPWFSIAGEEAVERMP